MKTLKAILEKVLVDTKSDILVDELPLDINGLTNLDLKNVIDVIKSSPITNATRIYTAFEVSGMIDHEQDENVENRLCRAKKLMAVLTKFRNKFGSAIFVVYRHGLNDVIHMNGSIENIQFGEDQVVLLKEPAKRGRPKSIESTKTPKIKAETKPMKRSKKVKKKNAKNKK